MTGRDQTGRIRPRRFGPRGSAPRDLGVKVADATAELKRFYAIFGILKTPKKVNRAIRLRETSLAPDERGEWLMDSAGQGGPASSVLGLPAKPPASRVRKAR